MSKLERLIVMLRELAAKGFYGSLTIRFQAGRIVNIRREESIKP